MTDSLRAEADRRRAQIEEARHPNTEPSLALLDYAGAYEDAMYGRGHVTVEDGRLVLRLGPAFVGDLDHWHHDTFEVRWRDPSLGTRFVTFSLDAAGSVQRMNIQGMVDFARVADAPDAVGLER